MLGEPGCLADRAVGVHLDDVLPGDVAHGIEVVDAEVAEDAAGSGDVRIDERFGRLRCIRVEILRDLEGAGRVGIGERERGDAVERSEALHVKGADPADTDHPDVEPLRHGSAYSKRLHKPLSRRYGGGAVELRTTRAGSSRCRSCRTLRPLASSSRSWVASSAISNAGWWIVVNGGLVNFESLRSSNPTIETSSGTRRPLSTIALITPIAERSFAANTAVKSGVSSSDRAAS